MDESRVLDLHRCRVAVGVLGDEGEVQDPDRAGVDQLAKRGRDLARELVAGKADDGVLDGSGTHSPVLLSNSALP